MYNIRNTSFSKRHVRRLIANETEIDIAGSSRQNMEVCNHCSSHKDIENVFNTSNSSINIDNVNNVSDSAINIFNIDYRQQYQNDINERDSDNESQICNIENVNKTNDNRNDEKFRNAIAEWAVTYNIPPS